MRALIVVDVQNDFCEGGALAVPGGNRVAVDINRHLLTENYRTVVYTQDWHAAPPSTNEGHFGDPPDFVDSWPVHCVAGTHGAQLHPVLAHRVGLVSDLVFRKGYGRADYSGFQGVSNRGHTLHSYLRLREVDEVDICGLAADYCVRQTALSAKELGYKVNILTHLTAAIAEDGIETTLELVESS